MKAFASVFPHMLRQMYRRLNSLGAALHRKRLEAERRACDIVTGRHIEGDGDGGGNAPIVLEAVQLVELRCLGYLEPLLRGMVRRQGCGRCPDCGVGGGRTSACEEGGGVMERPGWMKEGIMRLD